MKKVVSVSLGSSERDHQFDVPFFDQVISLERRGTNGDLQQAESLLAALDGKVDAIGLGGIDIVLVVGGKTYEVKDGLHLRNLVKRTPVLDGSGIKDSLERDAVFWLVEHDFIKPTDRVLMVSGLDRFGMAEALDQVGCQMTYGDLIFGASIPFPIASLAELSQYAEKLLPKFASLPFTMLYPTADKKAVNNPSFWTYYSEADVIAGDFHYIVKHLPDRLAGKRILTNTTTTKDRELLFSKGVAAIYTTTPIWSGRSFGTNVMEACFVAYLGYVPKDPRQSYSVLAKELGIVPTVLQSGEETA